MTYKMTLRVYDSSGNSVADDKVIRELNEPPVAEIKSLLNPGTYVQIKSETFIGDNQTNPPLTHVLKTSFVLYTINLS